MSDFVASIRSQLPSTWSSMSPSQELELVEVPSFSSEYTTIKAKVHFPPTRIVRVQNPFLWACYNLRKEEVKKRNNVVSEKELWHATAPSYVTSIATNNFDWRRSSRTKFGQGVCFSPDTEYANHYCTVGGALILCKVLVGSSLLGSACSELPCPKSYDTTTGNSGKVYVKYYDHEFYPEYVAYYDYVKPMKRRRYY